MFACLIIGLKAATELVIVPGNMPVVLLEVFRLKLAQKVLAICNLLRTDHLNHMLLLPGGLLKMLFLSMDVHAPDMLSK